MTSFTVFPAIDLRHGRCVRLRQGNTDAETIYSDQPVLVAQRWQDQGARWLHVVNLDGALEQAETWTGPNVVALQSILAAVTIPVQFGGGIRTLATIERLLSLGIARVILGTVAVSQPELVAKAVQHFSAEHVLVSLDARDGFVATHGWTAPSRISVATLGKQLRQAGLCTVVHTDIARDGMLSGANLNASLALARETGLEVIVSGGVASLSDIADAARHYSAGIAGVIIGQALYTGAINLREALQVAAQAKE
ncbi:MAG: 1-(5-phosphoribosyl)-5-[(5-phosphoribosylamino)methylideneamino]imidazole-4-carboxamide isomerase [Anaerolineae bacterium]